MRRAVAIQLIINQRVGSFRRIRTRTRAAFVIDELTDLVEEAVLAELSALSRARRRARAQWRRVYQRETHSGRGRPGTVHDFDGDKVSEVATSASNSYVMFEGDLTVNWLAPVQDASGWAAGTAFDFDGNGVAEAMYADETNLYVFDGDGQPLLNVPRSARTLAEYPVVADVDNDGSAEIVVVSDAGFGGNQICADGAGDPRHRGPVDPAAADLESAHLSRDQRARGRQDPAVRGAVVAVAQHVPHQLADRGRRDLHPADEAAASTWLIGHVVRSSGRSRHGAIWRVRRDRVCCISAMLSSRIWS